MRTFLKAFVALAVIITTLNSCDLEMYDDYTVTNVATSYIANREDKEEQDAIMKEIDEYFKSVPDFMVTKRVTGTYHEACTYAVELFAYYLKLIDNDFVISKLGPYDQVVYDVIISGKKIKEPIARFIWVKPEDDRPIVSPGDGPSIGEGEGPNPGEGEGAGE